MDFAPGLQRILRDVAGLEKNPLRLENYIIGDTEVLKIGWYFHAEKLFIGTKMISYPDWKTNLRTQDYRRG